MPRSATAGRRVALKSLSHWLDADHAVAGLDGRSRAENGVVLEQVRHRLRAESFAATISPPYSQARRPIGRSVDPDLIFAISKPLIVAAR
jgi:hypothetical protein